MDESIDWRSLPPLPEADRPKLPEDWRPSQTFLKTHDRCDRAAYLSLKYRGGAGSHPMNRGSLFHEAAARLTRLAIDQAEPESRVGSPEIGKDVLLEVLDDYPELQVSAAERDALRYMVSNFCIGEFWDPARVLAIESSFTLEIGGFTIVGRIDRADDLGGGELEVVDYKTSFSMPDGEEFKAESFDEEGNPRFAGDFQTMLYALGLAYGQLDDGLSLEGYERFRLRLAFPRYLYPSGLGRRTATVTRQQLLDFRFDVEHQLRRLREVNLGQGKWQPTPGAHCEECPAEYECPLPYFLRAESQLANCESIEDLERLAAAWHFGSRRNTQLKSRIKKAAERLGEEDPEALDLGGGERGIRIGRDLALLFLPVEREEVRDKEKLRADLERTVEFGEPFDWEKNYRYREGVEFAKRKIAPRRENGGPQ